MKILTYPDPFLATKGKEVVDFSEELRDRADQMIKDMYLFGGVGLAAIQVGLENRVFVLDISERKNTPEIIINPEITNASSEREPFEEGCLSVPGIRQDVIRPAEITLKWLDIDGEEHIQDFGGLKARVIQHELDHLNGRLFIQRLTEAKKILIKKALKDLEKHP